MPGAGNNLTVIVQGLGRCNLSDIKKTQPFIVGTVTNAPEEIPSSDDKEFMAAVDDLKNTSIEYVKKNEDIPDEAQFALQNINNAVILLNFICTSLPFSVEEKNKALKGQHTVKTEH